MWRSLGLSLFNLLAACGEPECTAVACTGGSVPLRLVDDAGRPVAARGEYRTNRDPPERWPFDCTVGPRASDSDSDCNDNVVTFTLPYTGPSTVLQMRFQIVDGDWSEWQEVPLAFEQHTDPDFNGPGCACSWYTAAAEAVLVPSGARLVESSEMP
jgi:hypothetical protein